MAKEKKYPYQNIQLVNLKGEKWKDVPGFEGLYKASNMGRVKSVDRIVPHPRLYSQFVEGKILSQSVAKNKNIKTDIPMIDLRVSLNMDGVPYYFNTRRLIYMTFVDPHLDYQKDGLYIINKDCDGYNNRLTNLKAVSRSEKSRRVFLRDRIDNYLKTADRSHWPKNYSRCLPVKQYYKRKLVATYESISEAVRKTGCDEKGISYVCKGIHHHCGGFQWKYAKKKTT